MSNLTMRALAVESFVQMLGALQHLFEKAEEAAVTKKLELAKLASARLAPDMYPFSMQVQLACYHAKAAVALLTGVEPPSLPKDDEAFEQLKGRLEQTVRELGAVPVAAFDGTEDRSIKMLLMGTMSFEATGLQYLRDWALPHFYFHVVTAYDILRHAGVEIGKRDFMYGVGKYIRQK